MSGLAGSQARFFILIKEMVFELEDKLAIFIKENKLFGSAEKVLLAISGGADSTALLYVLCSLKEKGKIRTEMLCAHINHLLRGTDSDNDEQFVVQQTNILNLPITTKRIDVRSFAKRNKISIETAARQLRIKALIEIAKENDCSLIATAHQADDNAETIIHRLLRGTGFRGLAGIWPKRKFENNITFVRPLLCVTRAEITAYLKRRNLKWQTDKTNQNLTFKRNYIRHLLLPQLQKHCSGLLVEQLSVLSKSAHKFYNSAYSLAERLWPEVSELGESSLKLDLKIFSAQHPEVKVEFMRKSLAFLGSGEKTLSRRHYEKILKLAKQKTSNKKVNLPNGFTVRREYNKLIFEHTEKSKITKMPEEVFALQIPGKQQCGEFIIESKFLEVSGNKTGYFTPTQNGFIEQFDFDKLQPPITVRRRVEGDRFRPLGMPAEKKVGKFLTDAKVPKNIREKMLIVADDEKIIWLWPIRISEQAKVTGKTKRIFQLQITDTKHTNK